MTTESYDEEEAPVLPPSRQEWETAQIHLRELKAQVAAKEQECERLQAEVERLNTLNSELVMQAKRDAHRADVNAADVGRLKAELEKRKLKWQTGKITHRGYYWYDPEAPFVHFKWEREIPNGQWAGPIEPPEAAPDKEGTGHCE